MGRAARAVKTFTMLQYFLSRTALIFCSVSLAVLTVACDQDQQTTITGESKQSLSTGSLAAIRSSSQRKQLLASPNSTPRALINPLLLNSSNLSTSVKVFLSILITYTADNEPPPGKNVHT